MVGRPTRAVRAARPLCRARFAPPLCPQACSTIFSEAGRTDSSPSLAGDSTRCRELSTSTRRAEGELTASGLPSASAQLTESGLPSLTAAAAAALLDAPDISDELARERSTSGSLRKENSALLSEPEKDKPPRVIKDRRSSAAAVTEMMHAASSGGCQTSDEAPSPTRGYSKSIA